MEEVLCLRKWLEYNNRQLTMIGPLEEYTNNAGDLSWNRTRVYHIKDSHADFSLIKPTKNRYRVFRSIWS